MNEAIKIVNYIKSRPLKSRLFKILWDDMGSLHSTLLFHTEIRWLSHDKVLTRLMELQTEVSSFQMNNNASLAETINDTTWLCHLSYLVDIFNKMNDLSLSLQGRTLTIFDASHRVYAFKRKLHYLVQRLSKRELKCFSIT